MFFYETKLNLKKILTPHNKIFVLRISICVKRII